MIQLKITMAGKSYSPKDKWAIFGEDVKSFINIQAAKDYLKEQYGKAKRIPMYVDKKDGKDKKVGYVIGFRNADYSHYPVQKWLQQDWIEFREVELMNPEK